MTDKQFLWTLWLCVQRKVAREIRAKYAHQSPHFVWGYVLGREEEEWKEVIKAPATWLEQELSAAEVMRARDAHLESISRG